MAGSRQLSSDVRVFSYFTSNCQGSFIRTYYPGGSCAQTSIVGVTIYTNMGCSLAKNGGQVKTCTDLGSWD